MPALFTFGRVLFAVLFIYTGATKLFAIPATADFIASKVTIPTLLAPYTSQLETLTGMPLPQLLAMSIGGFEILAGLMIALNFLARFFSILLIFFVPFSYLMDSMMYRSYRRRIGAAPPPAVISPASAARRSARRATRTTR